LLEGPSEGCEEEVSIGMGAFILDGRD
jgi:hypothetical protein